MFLFCRIARDSVQELKLKVLGLTGSPYSSQVPETCCIQVQHGAQPCHNLATQACTTQKVKMVLVLSAPISLKNKGKHTCRRIVLDSFLTWHCLYFSAWYHHDHLSWSGMGFATNLRGESILNVKYNTIFYCNNLFQNYLSFWFRGNKHKTIRYLISYVTATFQDKWWCKAE